MDAGSEPHILGLHLVCLNFTPQGGILTVFYGCLVQDGLEIEGKPGPSLQ